jgi:hypothetical protein
LWPDGGKSRFTDFGGRNRRVPARLGGLLKVWMRGRLQASISIRLFCTISCCSILPEATCFAAAAAAAAAAASMPIHKTDAMKPPPTRGPGGVIRFKDMPNFTPNLTPAEVLRLGSFGGGYFR